MLTKMSFGFTEDDMRIIKALQDRLAGEVGKVSYIAAIRWAIRKAVKA